MTQLVLGASGPWFLSSSSAPDVLNVVDGAGPAQRIADAAILGPRAEAAERFAQLAAETRTIYAHPETARALAPLLVDSGIAIVSHAMVRRGDVLAVAPFEMPPIPSPIPRRLGA